MYRLSNPLRKFLEASMLSTDTSTDEADNQPVRHHFKPVIARALLDGYRF